MKIKFIFLSFLFALFALQLCAQTLDTVSYVPVKQGYYDKISTKTKAQFATNTGSLGIAALKANSTRLNINTAAVTFGKPIYVKNNVETTNTSLTVTGALRVQGAAFAKGVVIADNAVNTTKVVARDLNLQNRNVRLTASSDLLLDGVSIPSPSVCTQGVEWKLVDAKNVAGSSRQYRVLGCKGTAAATCSAPQSDIDRCNNSADSSAYCASVTCGWDATNCCCKASTDIPFIDAAMCSGTPVICQGGQITSAAAVCNEYASDSAECVCASGNLKQCVGKVYGAGSDEAGCVQSGETHEACECVYFVEFQSDFQNYACTGIPAKCPTGGTSGTTCTATKPAASQDCGNCGTQIRSVSCDTSTGNWTTGAWGTCTGQGECSPGATNLVHCGRYTGYGVGGTEAFIYKEVTCTEGCTYPTVGNCDVCKESPNCNVRFANGQIGACYCLTPLQPSCANENDASLCTNCGGAWNATTCTCDCGTAHGVTCSFDSTYGCMCGGTYRSCI